MAEASFNNILSYLRYFLTLKGIFRWINFLYFVFFFFLSTFLNGALGVYNATPSIALHQSAIGFISFLCFWIPIEETVMSIFDILMSLSFLKPYRFYFLLGDTIAHGVVAVLMFIPSLALTAYAFSFTACVSNCGNIVALEATASFFGYVGAILLFVTTGVFIYLLYNMSGTKSSSDPV